MPPKKSAIDKELKKKNTEAAKSILNMLKQKTVVGVEGNLLGAKEDHSVEVDPGASSANENPSKKSKNTVAPKPKKCSGTGSGDAELNRPARKAKNLTSKESKTGTSEIGTEASNKKSPGKSVKSGTRTFHYEIDCHKVDDSVDVHALQRYITDQMKVNGKKNNLGENVTICCEEQKVVIRSKVYLPKRSLRFLSKKFLKKSWNIQVVYKNKNSYELKYVGTS